MIIYEDYLDKQNIKKDQHLLQSLFSAITQKPTPASRLAYKIMSKYATKVVCTQQYSFKNKVTGQCFKRMVDTLNYRGTVGFYFWDYVSSLITIICLSVAYQVTPDASL